MKKSIFIYFLFACTFFANAQANLEFSQVLTFNGSLSHTNANRVYSTIQTVPVDKVWKIEFIGFSSIQVFNNSLTILPFYGITINSIDIFLHTGNFNNSIDNANMPIWIKAGDQLRFWANDIGWTSGINKTTSFVFSIIEFNVAP